MPIGTYPQLLRDAWTISSKPLCCQYLGSRWNNDYQENLSRRICQMPQPLQVMRNTGLRIGSQSYTKLHWRHPTSGSFFQTWPLVHLLPPSSYLLRFIYPAGPFACLLPIPLAWSSSFLSLSLAYLAQEIWPPLVTGHLWVAHDHLPVDLCPSKWALVNPSLNANHSSFSQGHQLSPTAPKSDMFIAMTHWVLRVEWVNDNHHHPGSHHINGIIYG